MPRSDDLPTAWPDFRAVTSNRPFGEFVPWHRFAERYRIAHTFLGIRHREGSDAGGDSSTLDAEGHDALLGIALAGAAVESLEWAAPTEQGGPAIVVVESPDLRAQWLGRELRPMSFAVQALLDADDRWRLQELQESGADDMRPVVDAFHQVALRGDVTPAALQLDPPGIGFLQQLRVAALGAVDAAFTAWVRGLQSR